MSKQPANRAGRPYGRVLHGRKVPYGTLSGASPALRNAVYYQGYLNDDDLPPLPESPAPASAEYDIRDVERRLDAQRLVALLHEAADMAYLSHRRFKVLYMRNVMDMTLEEVGDAMGLTRERIRQIEGSAVRACKRVLRAHGATTL